MISCLWIVLKLAIFDQKNLRIAQRGLNHKNHDLRLGHLSNGAEILENSPFEPTLGQF